MSIYPVSQRCLHQPNTTLAVLIEASLLLAQFRPCTHSCVTIANSRAELAEIRDLCFRIYGLCHQVNSFISGGSRNQCVTCNQEIDTESRPLGVMCVPYVLSVPVQEIFMSVSAAS